MTFRAGAAAFHAVPALTFCLLEKLSE